MGSSESKAETFAKSLDKKEKTALKNVFTEIIKKDPGKDEKIPCIKSHKTLELLFNDYDKFIEKLYAWMIYCKKNFIGEEINKKSLSKEGIWFNSFMLSVEVLTRWMSSKVYYSQFERQDPIKLLLYILRADLKDPDSYFSQTSIDEVQSITILEAEKLFNLLYNFLNKTSNKEYSPFPFSKPIFEYDNKENADTKNWKLKFDTFKLQVKRAIPFTIKFWGKYMESQTIYNLNYIQSETSDQLWTPSSLNAKTTQMPALSSELKEKATILNDEIWCTLFLALPWLEVWKDIDIIYNSKGDGLSFNRLAYAIIGYKGPFIILIKHDSSHSEEEEKDEDSNNEYTIGVYVDGEIKGNGKFGGNLNCCLFCVSPHFKVLRTINNKGGTNYAYLNTIKIENSDFTYGLGFGGTMSEARLWLDGDDISEKSYIKPEDSTYEVGALLNKYKLQYLNISKVEIYGLGGIDSLMEQNEHRKLLAKLRDKRKQVDKGQLLENEFDKEFLLGNTYGHKKEMKNRGGN